MLLLVACCLFSFVRCGCVGDCGGGGGGGGSHVRLFVWSFVCVLCVGFCVLCRCVVVVVLCVFLDLLENELPRKHLARMFSLVKNEG